MKFDEEPRESMYSNWHQWRHDPTVTLQEKPEARARLSGQPRKASKAVNRAQEPQPAQIEERPRPLQGQQAEGLGAKLGAKFENSKNLNFVQRPPQPQPFNKEDEALLFEDKPLHKQSSSKRELSEADMPTSTPLKRRKKGQGKEDVSLIINS